MQPRICPAWLAVSVASYIPCRTARRQTQRAACEHRSRVLSDCTTLCVHRQVRGNAPR
jgi:hypothetical protein